MTVRIAIFTLIASIGVAALAIAWKEPKLLIVLLAVLFGASMLKSN
ncbi:hypothetical protein MnTg02_03470 [bacterium MnTg02]|nr:hypothetical protein MnTg02_03470 [bacterium MnTg02]